MNLEFDMVVFHILKMSIYSDLCRARPELFRSKSGCSTYSQNYIHLAFRANYLLLYCTGVLEKVVRKSHFEGSKPFLSCMLNAEFFSICIYRENVLFRLIFWVFKLLIWVLHADRYGISEYKQFIPMEYTTNVHCFQPTYFLRRK